MPWSSGWVMNRLQVALGRTISGLNSDVLFLGVHGVHSQAGLTTPNSAEVGTNENVPRSTWIEVVVAVNTELGAVELAKIAGVR
jgi:DeoR/GlpR family transcriptional regulator of sugar metabolism